MSYYRNHVIILAGFIYIFITPKIEVKKMNSSKHYSYEIYSIQKTQLDDCTVLLPNGQRLN